MKFCKRCTWEFDDTEFDECPDCKVSYEAEKKLKPITKPSVKVEGKGK